MLKSFYTQFSSAVCRVCLDSDNINMFPIYDVSVTDTKVISFADMLNECSKIQAVDGDNLPTHICIFCKECLDSAYKFKQLAEESDHILRHEKDVKPKIVFQNLDELKLKIEDKSCIQSLSSAVIEQDLTSIVENGGAIGNTLIKRVKTEVFSEDEDMEVEYLDDDFLSDSPPKKKQSQSKKVKVARACNIIASIEELDTTNHPKSNNFYTLKYPIPIQLCDELKSDKASKLTLSRASGKKIKRKNGSTEFISKKKSGPTERIKHVCPICGIQTCVLKSHLLTHAEQKPFKCEHCSKSFVQRGNYILHLKKHSGVKDQVCEVCGASFYLPKSVKRHRMIHNADKKFACHLCPKKFYVNCDLTRHLKVHSGYKPFKCETCSTMFNAKHQLLAHVRMHTGEKPYSCEVCNVSFTYKVNLNNHVHKIHGISLKFKSIHKITPDVLKELIGQYAENLITDKKNLQID